MTTIKKERQKIRQLVKQDKANSQTINSFYQQSLSIIANHLKEFYNEYADDSGLTLNQVSSAVSSWDTQHFYTAINEMLTDVQPDDKLSKQLQAAYVKASLTKRDMLGAMIGAGMSIATARSELYGVTELNRQRSAAYADNSSRSQQSVPQSTDQAEYVQRLWVHQEVMANRMIETLNKGLSRGISVTAMNKLTRSIPQSGDRIDDNLATPMNQLLSRIDGLMQTQSVENTNEGKRQAYEDSDVKFVMWLTEEDYHVCDICQPLDKQIFPFGQAPIPQEDTHPRCRCQLVACDEDGNLLDGQLDGMMTGEFD
ncbi:phage head morphogenesis protein [Levilactobacillus brevis]|uniref:phage head morphogenesis protein n=1 Tax=Levilactobacillus brevis TaxID=1580 RepID=UPI002072C76B|nr:phage head morphogenesis protein [Levilactobacillus brevis]